MTHRLGIVALLAVGLAVFYPALRAGFVDYDDPAFVTNNPYVIDGVLLTGIRWAFTQEDLGRPLLHEGVRNVWHPLTWLSHMIDAQLWGAARPAGHHAMSVLIHLVTTLLVYACFFEMLRSGRDPPSIGRSQLIAWSTAALFCVHPLHVESVAWISGRKDVLSGFFFFACLLAYLKNRRALSVVLFCVGLMAKPSIVPLPFILMLIDWRRAGFPAVPASHVFFRRVSAQMRDKLPWLVPAVIVAIIAVVAQRGGTHGDFMGSLPAAFRMLTLGSSILFYLWRTLVPIDLSFHYPYPAWSSWTHLAAAGAAGVSGLVAWRMRRRFPELLFGALWFALLLLPMSGVLYVGTSFTADRYTYLSLTGLFFAAAKILAGSSERTARLSLAAGTLLLAIGATLAHRQVSVWRNSDSLFTHAAKNRPRDPVGIQNLGGLYQRERKFTEAAALYERALALNPRDHIAHYNLGNCRRETGDLAGARAAFESSLTHFPGFAPAKLNLGLILADPAYSGGDARRATTLVREACEETHYRIPNYVAALIKLELARGNTAGARSAYEKTPDSVRNHPLLRKFPGL